MSYTPVILTSAADYDQVRTYIGITSADLSDDALVGEAFLGKAETFITDEIARQSANSVPGVAAILATTPPAVAKDKTYLKSAVICYIAHMFAVGMTSAVNTAVNDGSQGIDLGGIGSQWRDMRRVALEDCNSSLRSITNWKRWRKLSD